jgi:hypothetical protein
MRVGRHGQSPAVSSSATGIAGPDAAAAGHPLVATVFRSLDTGVHLIP